MGEIVDMLLAYSADVNKKNKHSTFFPFSFE